MRVRAGAAHAGGRDVDQAGVYLPQFLRPQAQAVHHAGRVILHQHVGIRRQIARDRHSVGVFQVQHDGAFCLAEDGVQFGGSAGIAFAGGLDFYDVGACGGQVAGDGGAGDDPAEVQDADAG